MVPEPPPGGYRSGQAEDPISGSGISGPFQVRTRIVWSGDCRSRTDMVSLPICNIVLNALKPERRPYPKELKTYGDHLRKKRLDLGLSQPQVAKIINVTPDSITNWELNRGKPILTLIPKIISFLGYSPKIIENPIKNYSIQNGLSQKEFARILEINPTTLYRIERGNNKMPIIVKSKIENLISNKV